MLGDIWVGCCGRERRGGFGGGLDLHGDIGVGCCGGKWRGGFGGLLLLGDLITITIIFCI